MRFRMSQILLAFACLAYLGCASVDKQNRGLRTKASLARTASEKSFEVGAEVASRSRFVLGENGDTGGKTGDTGGKNGDTGGETGDTGGETGDTGGENGDTGQLVVVADETSVVPASASIVAVPPPLPIVQNAQPIVTPAGEIAGVEAPANQPVLTVAFDTTQLQQVPKSNAWSIDLATALELTSGQNPQVNFARERIRESYARLDAANSLWLPSLRAGVNYNKHEGRIQDVAGSIIETSRNSLYNGLGAQAVGAGSPAVPGVLMNFHMRDSLFQPRIAGQMMGASRQASQVAANDALLETAIAYCDLLEASQLQVIADDTNEHMSQLAKITADYAQAGEGLPADADRSAAELAVRRIEVQRAVEQVRIRSVRLARQLSNDPQVVLTPTEPFLAPVELIEKDVEVASLVAQGLSSRPELTEQKYLVGEAIERLRREQFAPLVPSVLLGLSYGGNGGGLGSSFQNYGDRMDFDAAAFWEVRNMGAGERAARCEAQSRVRQARFRQVQALDRVAAEIVEANTQVQAKRDQIPLAESAIAAARDSYRRNQERIMNAQGLPIEVLQSIIALDQAQRLYASTVADYNRAQFRLHRALGFAVVDAS